GVLPGYPRIQACVRPAWFNGAPKIKIKSQSKARAKPEQSQSKARAKPEQKQNEVYLTYGDL
ncbi:hypothetical protein, partial [Pseudomonas veronii]|uniref:hypothetical protein n=1 Tax=Pseudomonas veronii TaxID=76761 RepID=UPI0019D0710D